MKNKTIIVFGSSRPFGNTRKIIDALLSLKSDIDVIDLNDYKIGYYDYEFKNSNDDFMSVMKRTLEYETIIFATPIYWYTMSAQLKTFIDRISDLLHSENKHIGRQLRGKRMVVISCGSDAEVFSGFEMPFRESANYLGMTYQRHIHTWLEHENILLDVVMKRLKLLVKELV